jgi:hypothetical protein
MVGLRFASAATGAAFRLPDLEATRAGPQKRLPQA